MSNQHVNFRTATTTVGSGTAAGRGLVDLDTSGSSPRPNRAPRRLARGWMIPVGIAAGLSALGIAAVVQQDEAAPPAITVAQIDDGTSRGPNADLPRNWTLDVPRASLVNRGPNADLPRDWTTAAPQTTTSSVNRGPNADLPRDAVRDGADVTVGGSTVAWSGIPACGVPPAAGPNEDLAPSLSGTSAGDAGRRLGPNADLPQDPTGLHFSGVDVPCQR